MAESRRKNKHSKNEEIVIRARPVSRGVAKGKAVLLYGRQLHFFRAPIGGEKVSDELGRFRSAVKLSKRQIEKIVRAKAMSGKDVSAAVLDVQKMFLEDSDFVEKIEKVISEQLVNAEWAVKVVTDHQIKKIKAAVGNHHHSRHLDLEDAADRLITALGTGTKLLRIPKGSVIVAKELHPSALIELAESSPKGVVTERGGWTSHTSILARELNLPAVTGVKHVLRHFKAGDSVLVDGNRGAAIINPAPGSVRSRLNGGTTKTPASGRVTKTNKSGELRTLDGRSITIRANADTPELYKRARKKGARGIGLFRSEYLFDLHEGFPSEEEQVKAYTALAESAGDDVVTIRTFDLNAGQLADLLMEREANPALGLRAIRLSLFRKRDFSRQLASILKASRVGKIRVCLPMVSDVSEIVATRAAFERERKKLSKKGLTVNVPPVGAMIEVPSAILTIDEITKEVDFLCLGTNDLVQYLLAADRDNETVAELFRTLHPAVIRAIKMTIDAAARARKELVICGEMAGSPFYVSILLGLGADTFSMNVNSIERVRQTVAGIAFEEAVEAAKMVAECSGASEAEELLKQYIRSHWSHVIGLRGTSESQ
jgi:phosphotransferase system enzyme I (PtsI)